MQHEVGSPRETRRLVGDVPTCTVEGEEIVGGEHAREGAAELTARPRDQGAASRADRIGVVVLHRCATRASFHATPCSSGSAESYSSVTW